MKILKKLREKRGSAELIGGIMVIIVVIICVMLIISASALAPRATAAYTAVHEIADKVAEDGQYGDTEQQYIQSYLNQAGLSATVTCDQSGVIQYGDAFTVTLKTNAKIGVGSIGQVSVPITAKAVSHSQTYTTGG